MLIRLLVTADLVDADILSARERAILEYADRLTREPSSLTSQHIRPLRDVGLDDRGIHDTCAIVAYFAFVNRIADGLGVELEGPDPR
ncbi:MAG: carboxymuconolactone decarboxylase family protein [Gemmatimonadaceae bacterium]